MAVMLMLTACNKDEPNNDSSSIMIMYNRAVNTGNNMSVTFSQSNCKFVVRNNSTLSMQANMILKVGEGIIVDFSTDFMPLIATNEAYTYTFESGNITSGAHTISNFRGKINLAGPTFIQYVIDGQYQCYSTLQPYYTETITSITTEPSTSSSYSFNDINYGLTFNNAGDKGTLYLFDFHADDSGRKTAILRYDNLTLVPTSTGYQLTGTDVLPTEHESNYDVTGMEAERYRATSLSLDVLQQGQGIAGTIQIGGEDATTVITLNGHFFETNL